MDREILCRACLSEENSGEWYSLVDHKISIQCQSRRTHDKQTEWISLAEIYQKCTQVSFGSENLQWEWICRGCLQKLVEFNEFRQTCINSIEQLCKRNVVKQEPENSVIWLGIKAENHTESIQDDLTSCKDEKIDAVKDDVNVQKDSEIKSTDDQFDFESYEGLNADTYDSDSLLSTKQEGDEEVKVPKKKSVYNRNLVECDFCQRKFNRKDQLLVHLRRHVSSTVSIAQYACDFDGCGKKYTTKKYLGKHKRYFHEGKKPKRIPVDDLYHKCNMCDRKFTLIKNYDAHVRKHQGLKPWPCTEKDCGKSYDRHSSLKKHIATRHFDDSNKMERPEFVCDVDGCGKVYTLKETLKKHILCVHKGIKPAQTSPKICELCGKSFKSNAALQKHTYTHTKITPFKCDICAKMFPTKYKLKEHKMRHEGIKKFVCPICGLMKITGHELRNHMKYHTDTKIPCKLCPMEFSRENNLNRHMKIVHLGIKKYKCEQCDHSFGVAKALKYHIMTHTGERPLKCEFCNKGFIQPTALKTHLKTHNK